jgi:hypothetical protein
MFLILELHLEKSQKKGFSKTIEPQNVGGRAGGEKYIINNILFKFAVDAHGLYGSDYAAAKAADNELRGLTALFNTADSRICYPLMALIDFLGVRLIAMSLLPLSPSTLAYGTADGGVTVHNDNEELASLIEEAASRLNLVPHVCGLYEMNAKVLATAADVEGHVGTDGRYYMLDFARMFPPTTPDPRIQRGYLYQVIFVERERVCVCVECQCVCVYV